MTKFTTNSETPDKGPFHGSIRSTMGIWVRRNYETDKLELWLDGVCKAEFINANILKTEPEKIMGEALEIIKEASYRAGRNDARNQMQAALGLK